MAEKSALVNQLSNKAVEQTTLSSPLPMAGRRPMLPFRLTLAALLAAACISLFFVIKLKPASAGAFAFLAVWLVVPHTAMAALLFSLQRLGKPLLPWCVAAVLVALGGLLIIMDAIYWHPDPQGAIGIVLTPVFQGISFLIAAPLAWWLAKRSSM